MIRNLLLMLLHSPGLVLMDSLATMLEPFALEMMRDEDLLNRIFLANDL